MTRRSGRRAGLRPLARKPKTLTEEPVSFEPGGTSAGPVLRPSTRSRRPSKQAPPGASVPATTDEAARVEDVPLDAELDPATLRRAQQIASRLALPRARQDTVVRSGPGAPASTRWRGGSDDIDLDATLESLVEHPLPADEDIVVRERRRTRRSVVLAVDVSGSMRGERVRTAAATVGALVGALDQDDLAVIAFWSDAALLAPLGRPPAARRLLDTLLRIPARGLTNLAFPLTLAAQQLARVPARDARVLLLSDCVHNAGPDPRSVVGRLPRLDVLLDDSGEHDLALARDLTRLGRGTLAVAHDHRDVAPAVRRMFTGS